MPREEVTLEELTTRRKAAANAAGDRAQQRWAEHLDELDRQRASAAPAVSLDVHPPIVVEASLSVEERELLESQAYLIHHIASAAFEQGWANGVSGALQAGKAQGRDEVAKIAVALAPICLVLGGVAAVLIHLAIRGGA